MTWLSAVVLVVAALVRPSHARCPRGWWLDLGVRADGAFRCALDAEPPQPTVYGFVYCTGGTKAIEVDGVAVGCQPGGWRN